MPSPSPRFARQRRDKMTTMRAKADELLQIYGRDEALKIANRNADLATSPFNAQWWGGVALRLLVSR